MDGHVALIGIEPQAAPARVVLEERAPLSGSRLWKLQRAYFERAGVDAWRQGTVPHFITSNPVVAAAYARVVIGFLRDVLASGALDRSEPIHIVELGSGSGRFAYHFLKQLFASPRSALLEAVPIRFVMTDVADKNLAFFRDHPRLQPFFERGVLDVARFDAERDQEIRLERSGLVLAPGALANPLVVIANYVFDGLRQHVFRVRDGRLHESLVTLEAPGPVVDPDDPGLLSRVQISFEDRPLEGEAEVDPEFRPLLEEYGRTLAETTFALPTGALSCVRALSRLAGGRMLLLSADKGHHREDDLLDQPTPTLAVHGSFSMMVNYHAIGRYIERLGGVSMFPAHRVEHLAVTAFLLGAPGGGVEARAAFHDAIEAFGPDDYFSVTRATKDACDGMSLGQLLAYLRLNGHDGVVFMDAFGALLARVLQTSVADRREIRRLAKDVWEMHYPIGEERDLPFHLGVLMRTIGYFPEAVDYFERSVELHGHSAEVAYNLAFCCLGLRRLSEALSWVDRALAEEPGLDLARTLRIQVRAAIEELDG